MERGITFRSKLGRRIVTLFVLCALLPVSILAVVSFFEVSSQLRHDSEKQLSRTSKNQGMEIYERLGILDSDLQMLSMQVKDGHPFVDGQPWQDHFSGLTIYGPDGSFGTHWGVPMSFPELTQAEKTHLLLGNSLLQVGPCGNGVGTCASLLRMSKGKGSKQLLVKGEANPRYLWSTQGLPLGLHLAVLTASRQVLFCSDENGCGQDAFPVSSHASGLYQWSTDSGVYDAAYWKLLVKPTFLEEPWTTVVSQAHDDALAPMLTFRKTFPLVVLLSLWIVMLFSMIQVRRTLGPLERLEEGTRLIGSQRFDSRVEVNSGDEFEALALSFNSMAATLGRQFDTLKTINEINQAIFASLDREAIVDGVLFQMSRLFAVKWFGICIFEDKAAVWTRFHDAGSNEMRTEVSSMTATDWLQLQSNPEAFLVGGDQRIPEYLMPLTRAGAASFLILPIRIENSIQAALICGQEGQRIEFKEMKEARQVADQLAVALSHARLIDALEKLHVGMLTALARAIDAKSEWTAGHSERVTSLSIEIAQKMGLPAKELKIIRTGGLLHDIGKIGTPPAILDKPDKLTAEEMRIMQDHVRIGVRILEPVPGLKEALPIVAQHHEWFNGKGYPAGVAGKEITLHARIAAVADCYDALTSDRPYRRGLPREQTIAMLRNRSGTQFDPVVINAFLQLMAEKVETMMETPVATGQSA